MKESPVVVHEARIAVEEWIEKIEVAFAECKKSPDGLDQRFPLTQHLVSNRGQLDTFGRLPLHKEVPFLAIILMINRPLNKNPNNLFEGSY